MTYGVRRRTNFLQTSSASPEVSQLWVESYQLTLFPTVMALAADKDRLIASAKQTALQLRHKELDYYIERYSNLATQSSIIAGFAFDSLVELEIRNVHHVGGKPIEFVYYLAGSCTMAFSLYTLCVSSFAIV